MNPGYFNSSSHPPRILVTGGAGSVGMEVLHELHHHKGKYEVRVLDRRAPDVLRRLAPFRKDFQVIPGDLNDPDILDRCTRDVDFTIHLAAVIPPLADKKPDLAGKVNVDGTRMLINALLKNSPGSFLLYSSSISLYGDRLKNPWIRVEDEIFPSEGDEYALTKIAAEKLVRHSGLRWSVFRLSAIMGPQTRMDPLFFHMPLDTRLEIATARDTGVALVKAIDHQEEIENRIFNLSGGPTCRTTYREFLSRIFGIMGLKNLDLPEKAFAERNFHCGYYADSEDLNNILHFQKDSLEDYYRILEDKQGFFLRTLTRLFHSGIKQALLKQSEPFMALKKGWKKEIERYYL